MSPPHHAPLPHRPRRIAESTPLATAARNHRRKVVPVLPNPQKDTIRGGQIGDLRRPWRPPLPGVSACCQPSRRSSTA